MGTLKIITIIQTVALIQVVSQAYQQSGSCYWTSNSSFIDVEDINRLSSHICLSLGCGDVYKLRAYDEEFNSTCFTGCLYIDSELRNCSNTVRSHCKKLSEVICGSPYVAQISSPCTWTIKSPDPKSSVSLPEDTVHSVSQEICRELGCGQVYSLNQNTAGLYTTCFTNCVYHNYQLKNCSEVNSKCSVLSEVKCGNAAVRLQGGGHRCGGRVEVWRGSWGTVCDDGWDIDDAHVVCAQLGCGYAVSVSGHGEPYGQGTGVIHMDELNCTGKERSLWECPAITNGHDCGHKEDAGVVCSEYKALRLTGGLDRCSGRVEVHRNGSWGTVCDTSWQKEEGAMACKMLNCGEVKQFTAFDPAFKHKHGSLWYFYCLNKTADLWHCIEYINVLHFCMETKAAGLICNNSLGLPVPTSPQPTSALATTVTTTIVDKPPGFFLTSEQLGCFVLGFLLLSAIITNILLCHHNKKNKAAVVQKKYMNLQAQAETEENSYRDSVHLVKVTNNSSGAEVPVSPQRIWAQSSIESASYDTDYEQHDISPETAFPLSTFQNSMRYSADGKRAAVKVTNLNSVMEEETTVGGYQQISDHNAQQMHESATSVDSFESSCTSSGECYENTGTNAQDPCSQESTECFENTGEQTADLWKQGSGRSFLGPTTDPSFSYQELDKEGGSREDSPLYSPVSYDNEAVSSESDYDDIGNYLQQPSNLH
ncbi:T-cell differentiation antigen CD6-like isoform X2 [Puntigrus tetrazona]|uniref:T-cell differentiation antigen CD6-like isoform X2 n=1 Tax=Puntigrus tetrazona TaxID=1606681 RepID=UPI001C897AD1|nr:T-cell differentiation antigen CD6-like isoform X2 [Puntigrus tetrazona]